MDKKVTGCYEGKKDPFVHHGLRLTAAHYLIECKPGKPFSWLPEEVANARREADKDPLKNSWVVLQNHKEIVSTEK